ncbi:envelope polyprotein [Simian retrovirus 1]|uniref:Envelope glycoprotein n=1 Tax=Simian retrovirus SRV-1 TaxID=11942 RepID=ENV_SRV1|nr:RecName: Full=Envelope glycoprotein; AltName: Full=Env polyprotein; Contains: RecName: Full=Surface protein; Short=SU; AltName: Full=Glycoprotein 70; Short=gp70; Contains: RecName: Full=Transmembrane protein; Short=TM; AltName: Full=Glycoprotein 20; Short=gp20; Contains: RecName: Full=R-peptide; Flags: Precursor [Simian retrovirus 1]pir/VCLJSA/ env polyprotein - simian AIDS retrovirus SRV-1 [Simian retrovirus 1]AAA47733.1 envelope polyprotein [Simian retrovirus 1]
MNFNHHFTWSLVIISQIFQVQAGFGDPREALLEIQQKHGKPCDCAGGYVSSPPTNSLTTVSCSTYTAYSVTNSLKWQCVSTPTTASPTHIGSCPSQCNSQSYDSVHATCYNHYQQCTIGNKTYLTATMIRDKSPSSGDGNVPTILGNNQNLIIAGCPENKKGQVVCWNSQPSVHMSDGGGPQDKVREIIVNKKFEELHKSLFPELSYHPLALPEARGKEKIDAHTFDLLATVHSLLNVSSQRQLAEDCWLCLRSGDPVPLALPYDNTSCSNSTFFFNCSNCSCLITPPFLVQPFNFTHSVCLYADYQNNSFDIDVGLAGFTNCSSYINISKPSSPLCAPNSSVFVCGNNKAYTYLPTNWTGSCVLATLLPDIDIIPGSEPVPIPAIDHFLGRPKRAIQFIPLVIGLGITTAVSTGTAGLGVSLTQYTKLSHQLISDVQAISSTIQDLQDQVDSLAEVVLQNRRGLDLLTAEQGGICLALQEKCCFYANKSGIVRDKIKNLQDDLEKRRKQLIDNPFWTGFHGLLPYVMPLLGPLLCLLLVLSFGPIIFNKLMTFIKHQIESIQAKPIQVHYHRLEQEDHGGSYLNLT